MAQKGDMVICPKCGKEGELSIVDDTAGVVTHRVHLVTDKLPGRGEVSFWYAGRNPGETCSIDAETVRQLSPS